MRVYVIFIVVQVFLASNTMAGQVPGTSVNIKPPHGFVASERFPGYMDEATGSSIMVSEIPGPYDKVTSGLSDRNRMKAQGITLLSKQPVKIDGHAGLLLYVEQTAYGKLVKKWIAILDRSGATVLIVASYPVVEETHGELLKTAILATTFGKASDPLDALNFTVTPSNPLRVATVFGQNVILSPDGQFPVKDESVPFMVIGLSASEGLIIHNKHGFAESRIMKTAKVKNISIYQNMPIMIGGLSGFATIAKGIGEDAAATPLSVYQILLFDQSGYCLIQGITPTALESSYMPIFQNTAMTFKMKGAR